jgi:hypothetical protein
VLARIARRVRAVLAQVGGRLGDQPFECTDGCILRFKRLGMLER